MTPSIKIITTIFALSTLVMGYQSHVQAHTGFHATTDQGEDIRVYQIHSQENTMYSVNGKRFTWADLSKEQQDRIRAVEDKIDKAERAFQKQEVKIEKITAQIEDKARLIEAEARKIEQAFVNVSKDKMNFHDLEKAMRDLELATQANELAIRSKELELDELDDKLDAIDLSMVAEIDQHAQEYERVLLQVASELK